MLTTRALCATLAGASVWLAAALAQAQDAPYPGEPMPAEPSPPPAAAPGAAPAPEYTPPPMEEITEEAPLRKGFLGGAAVGLGSVNLACTGTACGHYAGLGFSLDAGYAFAPRWAVVGEIWFTGGVANGNGDAAGQLWTFSANVRYWIFDNFWVQGGLGGTSFDRLEKGKSGSTATGGGGGLALGAGVELWRAPNGHLVLDLRAKLGLMSIDDPSLGDGRGDKISTRQTTAMITLDWY